MAVQLRVKRLANRFAKMKMFAGGGSKSKRGDVYINVTAMVDMMTVLVIFLVMQFSANGEMLFISKSLKMPSAEHGSELTRIPIIALNRENELYFEGELLARNLAPPSASQDWKIAELTSRLSDNKERFEAVDKNRAEHMAPEENPTAAVNIQVDEQVDFAVLKRVLNTCEQAGYGRIRLALGDRKKVAEVRQ